MSTTPSRTGSGCRLDCLSIIAAAALIAAAIAAGVVWLA
jgi:hypothetical protein